MIRITHWSEWASLALTMTLVLFAWVTCGKAHTQASNGQANQIEINSQIAYGLGYQSNEVFLNYVEPGTTTALFGQTVTVAVPANTTNYPINLATMFPNVNTAIMYAVEDISNPGQQVSIGMDSGGSRFIMAPGGFFECRVNGSSPTLYVDNASVNQYALLKVVCIAN